MRVLVAGGAGFIGTPMCRRLLERGDEVVCVDNLVTGRQANIDPFREDPAFRFVEADICNPVPVDGALDAVVNLASPASPVDFTTLGREILDAGSLGTANLIDLAGARGARFLQASTSEVYGDPLCHPQHEEYFGNVDPIGLRAVYDEAKRFGEALVAYEQRRGRDAGIARIFNTYGPGMRLDDGRVVTEFIRQALTGEPLTVHGDGSQTRSLCFVEDMVTGLLAVLASGEPGPINLGAEDEWPIAKLAALIVELAGSSSEVIFSPRPAGDPERRRPDLTRARRLIGWEPVTPLHEGLAATIDWCREQLARRGGRDG